MGYSSIVRLFLSMTLLLMFGCVSIDIASKKVERSKEVKWIAPHPPFVELKSDFADKSWVHSKDGSSISFYSDCSNQQNGSLEAMQQSLTHDMDDRKIILSRRINYNSRVALDSITEGSVDGILTRVHTLIFRKNNCFYTLTYVSLESRNPAHEDAFKVFLEGFKAP